LGTKHPMKYFLTWH